MQLAASLYARNLLFFTTPRLWPHWPFLPLVRRHKVRQEEYGVLVDALAAFDQAGYSSTVFLSNLFDLPDDFDQVIKLPKETFDMPEEIFSAGWRVD
jgi:hypothetical protein